MNWRSICKTLGLKQRSLKNIRNNKEEEEEEAERTMSKGEEFDSEGLSRGNDKRKMKEKVSTNRGH